MNKVRKRETGGRHATPTTRMLLGANRAPPARARKLEILVSFICQLMCKSMCQCVNSCVKSVDVSRHKFRPRAQVYEESFPN